MDWNKEIVKGPLPPWLIVLFAILSGFFLYWIVSNTSPSRKHDLPEFILSFVVGASAYFYLWVLARLAKNPPPWLRKNFRLIVTIGALINALLILWSMLAK